MRTFRSFTPSFSWMHLQETGEQVVLAQSPTLQAANAFFPCMWGLFSASNGKRVGGSLQAPHKDDVELPTRTSKSPFFFNTLYLHLQLALLTI